MKLNNNDLENIIAICDQDEGDLRWSISLRKRAERALVYWDVTLRLSFRDILFLRKRYDKDMDEDAKATLDKILSKKLWKIWIRRYDKQGEQIGAAVFPVEYMSRRSARRSALNRFGVSNSEFEWIVSQDNPFCCGDPV